MIAAPARGRPPSVFAGAGFGRVPNFDDNSCGPLAAMGNWSQGPSAARPPPKALAIRLARDPDFSAARFRGSRVREGVTIVARPQGFGAQFSVLRALTVRDALSRFGHENLGFFWVILEPLMFTMGVSLLWSYMNHTHGRVSTVTFILTGYSVLTMFRHILTSSTKILSRNLALRFHANVKPLDIYLARSMLESLGCLAAFYVAYAPLALLGVIDPMRVPLIVMGAWVLATWFCMSLGLIFASLSELSDALERVLPVTLYLRIVLTGAFTMQSWLPPEGRKVLSWSPLANIMEMFRNGMFPADVVTTWDAWFVIWWCFAQTVIGFVMFDYVRRRLVL